tara:strand:- start:704 stop:1924 length:1221 start_codon:yes stop_codon:yes gene_type:complete
MKIAVLVFGQPRFYKETAESFNREFRSLFDHDVDVFMHCWTNLGYNRDYDTKQKNIKLREGYLEWMLKKLYNPLKLVVEDPSENFYAITNSISNIIKTYKNFYGGDKTNEFHIKTEGDGSFKGTILVKDNEFIHRYTCGQFYSLGKAVQLKKEYEEVNNFKYDLVVKTCTDRFYPIVETYKDEEHYLFEKDRFYSFLHNEYEGRGILCHGLKLNKGFNNRGMYLEPHFCGCCNIQSISFKDGKLEELKTLHPEQDKDITSLVSENGILSHPYKIWCNDMQMCADSESADRAWGRSLICYLSQIQNQLIRYASGKNIMEYLKGETIAGTTIQMNNCRACSTHKEPKKCTSVRAMKVIHPLNSEREKSRRTYSEEELCSKSFLLAGTDEYMKNLLIRRYRYLNDKKNK